MKNDLFKNKKGSTRESFLFLYLLIFVSLGTFLPFIQASFNEPVTQFDTDQLSDSAEDTASASDVNAFDIVFSVLKMFFWTFGDLPFWIDLFFVIFRIHAFLLLITYIPLVG
ncbi:hypothetical protein LCGC14_0577050 [marine sediment metagenome]|uniref:Uncharacterized protein n=1 Tax=marine sediment metagenome TaxID=412755 RepID=A0A0F9UQT9_9ZZZZ